MDLKTLQNIFAETVLHGTDFSTLPIDEKGLDVGARLSIHQRNTYRSLVDFLGLSFPQTNVTFWDLRRKKCDFSGFNDRLL
jgi:hypothetical protein